MQVMRESLDRKQVAMNSGKTAIRLAILLLATSLVLGVCSCSLVPDDMVNTLPQLTSEVTTTVSTDAPIIDNPILITEIMTTNRSILQTADLNTPDWIELYNAGNTAVNLENFGLSDKLKKPMAWTFPAVVIEPGEYLIVYASGMTDAAAVAEAATKGEIHANFRLSGAGDELIFSNPNGQVLARLTIPAVPADLSYGLLDSAQSATAPYYYFGIPTPGKTNGADGHENAADAQPVIVSDLVINEYATDNNSLVDINGDYPDWVEILNTGSEPVSLLGCWLSDNPDDPELWTFPDVTIQPGGLLVVWLSGAEITYDPANPATLHASFRLGDTDEVLLLSDAKGHQLIRQTIEALPLNVSLGRAADNPENWLYYPQPTPGQANTTQGFTEIKGAMTLKNRGVWINEVAALDATRTSQGTTSEADWIELYNGAGQTVDLTGYGLSDDRSQPFQQKLDGLQVEPGAYLVIEPAGYGIAVSGETLYLTAPDGRLVDWYDTGALRNGLSSGRGNTDGNEPADSRFFYAEPTRGAANSTAASLAYALEPVIQAVSSSDGQLQNSLYLDGQVLVSLVSSQPGAVIHYTLDGSLPDAQSAVYLEPLVVDGSTVIRCQATLDGCLPSTTVCRTFLAGDHHDLPVVSIIGEPADFFDSTSGIWTNYSAKLEHAADIDYYEADGTPGVSFIAGVGLHGSYSRTEKQKSLELNLRTLYGDSQVTYPFFPDNEVSSYKRLILRTSGQDWRYTKLRDAFMTEVIQDYSELDTMDWRFCVVYINGEYYGLYEIRESVDQYYMEAHHGTDPDQVDIIKGNKIILGGTYDAYGELMTYVKNNDMTNPEAYAHVLSLIDENSLMDFLIAQTFFNNLDSGNKKFWCERTEGAQWRWVFFDLDWAMFPSTYTKNILKYDLLDPAGHGQQNMFSSLLQVRLMQNSDFKQAFIERYAWFLNNVFQTDRMLGILDQMTELIRSEMPRQIARWNGPTSLDAWSNNVSELRRITSEKRGRMLVILQESFDLTASQMKTLFPEDYP